jgi:hypothetical protein
MPKNTVGDFIKSVFPTLVNKDHEVFKALFANSEGTGTVERLFNGIEAARNAMCNNSNVYNQEGEVLEKTLSYFSVLNRLFMETEESFKSRNELIFYRNGDTAWGDKWNVLGIFKALFNTDKVYIVNNTDEISKNLLLDGDFEGQGVWELEDCAYNPAARFSENAGVLFNSAGTCKQTVNVDADSTYFIHFFLKGNIKAEIIDNNGRYWNGNSGEFGIWQTEQYAAVFSTEDWDAKSLFFLTDETVRGITVQFTGYEGIAYLDYVRLFKKENYPSFTLIACLNAGESSEAMNMAPGANDPVEGIDYSKMSYFEISHVFGQEGNAKNTVVKDIFGIVRAAGIASYIELLTSYQDNQEG